jgi:hypothetical protein
MSDFFSDRCFHRDPFRRASFSTSRVISAMLLPLLNKCSSCPGLYIF